MITDYSKYPTADAAPIAVNMLESFRAVGYILIGMEQTPHFH